MKAHVSILALAILVPAGAQAADETELHCTGSGMKENSETATVNSIGKTGKDKEKSTTIVQSKSKVPFDGAADLKIGMGSAKVRVPDIIRPGISSGKKDGWLEASNLQMDDREIKGTFSFNFANKPKFRVDRLAGEMHISGSSTEFTGARQKLDVSTKRRL